MRDQPAEALITVPIRTEDERGRDVIQHGEKPSSNDRRDVIFNDGELIIG